LARIAEPIQSFPVQGIAENGTRLANGESDEGKENDGGRTEKAIHGENPRCKGKRRNLFQASIKMKLFFRQRALRGHRLPSQARQFFILSDAFSVNAGHRDFNQR
jgi:hypothetical protein